MIFLENVFSAKTWKNVRRKNIWKTLTQPISSTIYLFPTISFKHLDTYKSEADRLQAEHAGVLAQLAHLETERRVLRDELKELRQREQSLLNDNNELEEENIVLQKQVFLPFSLFSSHSQTLELFSRYDEKARWSLK